jgi:hypothetical protein
MINVGATNLIPLVRERAGAPFWDKVTDGYEEIRGARSEADILYLGNGSGWAPVPGIADVKATVAQKLNIQKSKGRDGSTIIDEGRDAAKVTITVTLWTPEQWSEFQEILSRYWRNFGKLPTSPEERQSGTTRTNENAVSVSHWCLQMLKIFTVVIQEISSPEPGPVAGAMKVTIKAVEYAPTSAKVTTRKVAGKANKVGLSDGFQQAGATSGLLQPPSVTAAAPTTPRTPVRGG